jgi:hypothetical protein
MQTWLCAFLFILVGYLLAIVIGMLMNYGKVKDTNKLNRDEIIGVIDGFAVAYFEQNKCKWYGKSTIIAKKVYNELLQKYSEKQIVEYMNQLLGKEQKQMQPEQIQIFLQTLQNHIFNHAIEAGCPTDPVTQNSQAPQNYNLGPAQYMPRNGCGM